MVKGLVINFQVMLVNSGQGTDGGDSYATALVILGNRFMSLGWYC